MTDICVITVNRNTLQWKRNKVFQRDTCAPPCRFWASELVRQVQQATHKSILLVSFGWLLRCSAGNWPVEAKWPKKNNWSYIEDIENFKLSEHFPRVEIMFSADTLLIKKIFLPEPKNCGNRRKSVFSYRFALVFFRSY